MKPDFTGFGGFAHLYFTYIETKIDITVIEFAQDTHTHT